LIDSRAAHSEALWAGYGWEVQGECVPDSSQNTASARDGVRGLLRIDAYLGPIIPDATLFDTEAEIAPELAGPPASRVSEQSTLEARNAGTVRFQGRRQPSSPFFLLYMRRLLSLIVVATLVGAVLATVGRPTLERAWFVYTLATDAAPAHLPNPVRAAGAPTPAR